MDRKLAYRKEIGMPGPPWFSLKERIQKLRETRMLEWICHLIPINHHWGGPDDIHFTSTVSYTFFNAVH